MEENLSHIIEQLSRLYKNWSGSEPEKLVQLPNSGSARVYFRFKSYNQSALGVYNTNHIENIAFIKFTEHFLKHSIHVPQIYSHDLTNNIYLIEDLGDTQLLSWLNETRTNNDFPEKAVGIYKVVLKNLLDIQITAGKDIDYSYCYPFKSFDKEAIIYDLNYFKVNFIESLNINYNSSKLQNDFEYLANYLLKADSNFFMYRDFQARNILLKNNIPYYIDYQGGRKGALQYDLVSLLYQAKADIPESIKLNLLHFYIEEVNKVIRINNDEFIEYYYGFTLLRILQTLGAYGLRGLKEGKKHFIESIPIATKNIKSLIGNTEIIKNTPELKSVINNLND